MAGKNESKKANKKADKRVFPRIETVPATLENLRKFFRDLSAIRNPEFWFQRMRADAIRALQFANPEFPAEYSESDLRLAAASSESSLYAVQALSHLDNTKNKNRLSAEM